MAGKRKSVQAAVGACVAAALVAGVAAQCSGSQVYTLNFTMNWTSAVDSKIPDGAAYSKVFAIATTADTPVVNLSRTASPALAAFAKDGDSAQLEADAKSMVENKTAASYVVAGDSLNKPVSTVSLNLTVSGDIKATVITVLTRLSPSPAWFAGVLALETCTEESAFQSELESNIRGYDAGTSEEGTAYTDTFKDAGDAVRNVSEIRAIVVEKYGVLGASKSVADTNTSGSGSNEKDNKEGGGVNIGGVVGGLFVVVVLIVIAVAILNICRRMRKPIPMPLSGVDEEEEPHIIPSTAQSGWANSSL